VEAQAKRNNSTGSSEANEILEQRLADFVVKLHSYQRSWEGGATRQCSEDRDYQRLRMSQSRPTDRPASRSSSDGRGITLPPIQLRDDQEQASRQGENQGRQDQDSHAQRRQPPPGPAQSPTYGYSPTTAGEGYRPVPSRVGVHAILNPSESDTRSSSPRLSGGTAQSLNLTRPSSYQGSPLSTAKHGLESTPTSSPPGVPDPNHPGRRILTPRSPRAVSMSGRVPATINAQQTPFLSSRNRVYTADPASSEIPAMPKPASQNPYPLPPTDADLRRRASATPLSQSQRAPASHSTSPSPSITSSYSGSGPTQTEPRQGFTQQAQSYYPGSSFGASIPGGSPVQAAPGAEGPYNQERIFVSSSSGPGQASSTRMLPMNTDLGQFYIPVDIQAASRVADEKRARNAGASARFRERRKAKEQQASSNIQRLEQQSRDLERKLVAVEQERDFYRAERDRFRDMIYMNPATREQALTSPPSPRLNRPHAFPPPTSGHSFQMGESGISQEQERAPRRRKTSAEGEYSYPPPAAAPIPPFQSQNYGQPGPGHQVASLPPIRMENAPAPGPSAGAMQAPPNLSHSAKATYDPRSGYGRGWPGGLGEGPKRQ
jgi:hypothetical protein